MIVRVFQVGRRYIVSLSLMTTVYITYPPSNHYTGEPLYPHCNCFEIISMLPTTTTTTELTTTRLI